MRTLVVVPTYNERATIEELLRTTRKADGSAHILVVDDGSPDGTADLAEAVEAEVGGVTVMRRTRKSGLGEAYRAGFRWGLDRGFEALIEMDADLSHDPCEIPVLIGLLSDHDLAIGSRYVLGGSVPRWGVHRRLISWAGNRYSALLLGLKVRDLTSGFRAYRSEILERIELESVRADGYGFQIEMTYLVDGAGGRIVETPIRFQDRTEGESKMSTAIATEAFKLVTKWGIERRLRQPKKVPKVPVTLPPWDR